ncbi:MAG: hypothetical protein F4X59_17530 [Holophagales bacterium]|nr:hypothetical protein [Holophagales bacterium]MYC11908.1 hypothetical protein [Holophagales bacterium]
MIHLLQEEQPDKTDLPAVIEDRSLLAPPEALAAAARIRAAWTVAQIMQAQVLEGMWEVQKAIPDESQFALFVERETPFTADQGHRMVKTWEVARSQRELRELAQSKPSEALGLITSAIDEGVDLADEDDATVAKIMALKPRKRHSAIRELVQQSKSGESSATRERIRTLEAERDAAVDKLVSERKVAEHPGSRHQAFLRDLEKMERTLANLAMDSAMALAESPPGGVTHRVLSLTDTAQQHIDMIAGMVVPRGPEGGRE